jgi:hypothetical protein
LSHVEVEEEDSCVLGEARLHSIVHGRWRRRRSRGTPLSLFAAEEETKLLLLLFMARNKNKFQAVGGGRRRLLKEEANGGGRRRLLNNQAKRGTGTRRATPLYGRTRRDPGCQVCL